MSPSSTTTKMTMAASSSISGNRLRHPRFATVFDDDPPLSSSRAALVSTVVGGDLADYAKWRHRSMPLPASVSSTEGGSSPRQRHQSFSAGGDCDGGDSSNSDNDEGGDAGGRQSRRDEGGDIGGGGSGGEWSIDRCAALLEPHLADFRSRRRRDRGVVVAAEGRGKIDEDDDVDGEDSDDEPPPQLVRVARFFPWRWIPIKRALLRPPLPTVCETRMSKTAIVEGKMGDDGRKKEAAAMATQNEPEIEIGALDRLRLAWALRRKGLVSSEECKVLRSVFSAGSAGAAVGDEINDGNKRKKEGYCDEEAFEEEVDDFPFKRRRRRLNLRERTRLALLGLSSEVVARAATGVAATTDEGGDGDGKGVKERRVNPTKKSTPLVLRRVEDVVSECRRCWRRGGIDPKGDHDDADDRVDSPVDDDDEAPTPEETADWAMTSFTALVLCRGTLPSKSSSALEQSIAGLLSSPLSSENDEDTSPNIMGRYDATTDNDDVDEPTVIEAAASRDPLTDAVYVRIDELLSPPLLRRLGGHHIFALGRLLSVLGATSAESSRKNAAEDCFVRAVVAQCVVDDVRGGGWGGSIEPLSRLFAVYCSCLAPSEGGKARGPSSSSTEDTKAASCYDLERRLRSKLDCVGHQAVKEFPPLTLKKKKKDKRDVDRMIVRARSLLGIMIRTTVHLVAYAGEDF